MSGALMSETLWLLLLVPAGFVAGIVNVLAGGGSFLTLPMLMAAGLPVNVANGTNRIAVALQAVVATSVYQRAERFDGRLFRHLLPPLLAGALLGAVLATVIDPDRLRRVFGMLFVAMGAFLLWKQARGRPATAAPRQQPGARVRLPVLFLIGVYGGFLQAGVGLWILLSTTSLLGVDALRANAVKLPLVMTFTLPALAIFLWADQVQVIPGLLLGVGNVLGTFVGVRLSLKGGAQLIFRAVTLVLLGTGLYLLFG